MIETIEYRAAGGVVIDGDQMLLLDRPKRGEVRLPKGHIEADETPDVTALRETTEETGYDALAIVADLGSQVVEFDHKENHYRRTEYYFLMRLTTNSKKSRPPQDELQFRILWTPLVAAEQVLTYPAEKNIARKAIEAYTRLL